MIATAVALFLGATAGTMAMALISGSKIRRLEEKLKTATDNNIALSKQIELRKPLRGPKGLFIKKPKHNSANDPVVQQFRDA